MKHKHNRLITDERGIALVVELVVAALVLGVIGFATIRLLDARKDAETPGTDATAATANKEKSETWTQVGPAVTGKYADADVVQIGDQQWRLYYASQPEGGHLDIYSATSTDGKNWTPDAGVRKSMATFPSVIKLQDGRYRMYIQQAGVIKSAISADGLTFTDESGTRIDLTNPASLALDNVAAPTVLQQSDGTFVMVYRGTINTRYAADTPNPTTQVLLWATSSDGLTFTKKGLAVDSRNATLAGQLDGPELVEWDDGKLRVFATSYTGVYEFTFDGSTFSAGTLAFSLGKSSNSNTVMSVAPPGDPTVAKIDGVWYMYYGVKDGIDYATLQ